MKPLRYPTKKEESDYMRMRKEQNLKRVPFLKAENWFHDAYLVDLPKDPRFKFSRQACWGYRLFDFWFASLGVAIEIDGPEHDSAYDSHRDRYNFLRSGIVVLRVKNFDMETAVRAIEDLRKECLWAERREAMGLLTKSSTRASRRELAKSGDWQEALQRVEKAGLFCSYAEQHCHGFRSTQSTFAVTTTESSSGRSVS